MMAKPKMMMGHGSKMVEGSAMDKKMDKMMGAKEGSAKDKRADIKVGKALAKKGK